jgi:hypothetical protein
MAYKVRLFARSGEPVVQRVAPALLEAASRLASDLVAVHTSDGVGVAEYAVSHRSSAGSASSPMVSLTILTGIKVDDMAPYADSGGPARLLECDTQIELILTGGEFTTADWAIVRAICRAAGDLWDAVLYDETDGFALTIDDV